MTWASQTMSATINRTKLFLRKRMWLWPLIAILLLTVIGWMVHGAIERTMVANLHSQLQTLLNVEVAMLETWMKAQENNALSVAGDSEVRALTRQLVAAEEDEQADMRAKGRELASQIGPAVRSHDYTSFFLADREKFLADSFQQTVGMEWPNQFQKIVEKVFEGETTVTAPFGSRFVQKDELGVSRTGVPTMFVLAPVLDEHLQVIAILGLRIAPEREFTRILQLGQLGDSGETYAFSEEGMMLSNSRFDEELILLGLLPDQPGSHSMLQLLVRDPGGDITSGFRPKHRRSELEPTVMVQSAVAEGAGSNLDGYRDYRGVQVVGTWMWLDKYGFGVATEIDYEEAFRPLTILKRTFWGLLILLGLSSVAIFGFTVVVARLQRQAREAAIEARQLGQYQLEEKLGEGAMGVVFRGRHAMLRRPTAIKLLSADKVSDEAISRFEREVQITSCLNHPNTVAIYDYGRTPEGVFYYAMEFLEGMDLQSLVDRYGPQPPGRVIYVLRQICGSLFEAHAQGLVHRDIKPANVMLCRRGGEGDVVKVLDFGLVKSFGEEANATNAGMAGTPLYMSPEAIQFPNSVDACSDLYAVGAVGYFLLTGDPVFDADNLVELSRKHVDELPQPPSVRLGRPVPEQLENAILKCLEKSRARRPQTARDLTHLLAACPASDEWTVDDADAWWGRHERGQLERQSLTTQARGYDATILHESELPDSP